MLFGSKEKKTNNNETGITDAVIKTMPVIFYGGDDPTVYKINGGQEKSVKFSSRSFEKKVPSSDAFSLSSKKFWIIIVLIFLGAIGLITWYYVREAYSKLPQKPLVSKPDIVQPKVTVPETTSIINEPSAVITSTMPVGVVTTTVVASSTGLPEPVIESPVPKMLVSETLQFPKINSLDSVDLDNDSLTDIEEELFKTDSGKSDTDNDGYSDGQEVVNLHDPGKPAPAKFIDSGLVGEYSNPVWGYRLYYPLNWEPSEVDSTAKQVLISSITGDYIEVRAFKKDVSEIFTGWFGRMAKGESYNDYSEVKNNFGVKSLVRKDNLVAFFASDTDVYSLVYKPAQENDAISFRHVMEMVVQSFRLKAVPGSLGDQLILPKPPT